MAGGMPVFCLALGGMAFDSKKRAAAGRRDASLISPHVDKIRTSLRHHPSSIPYERHAFSALLANVTLLLHISLCVYGIGEQLVLSTLDDIASTLENSRDQATTDKDAP